MNEFCVRRLAVPGPACLIDEGAQRVVDRALELFGERLAGVVVYGSFARGGASPASDVDLLVVLTAAVPVTRDLYRQWDAEPVLWGRRSVDPHFVCLPEDGRQPSGAWCEAAVDGIVLFERDGAVTRHLSAVRGSIADGRLVRRSVHGQPYWTTVPDAKP